MVFPSKIENSHQDHDDDFMENAAAAEPKILLLGQSGQFLSFDDLAQKLEPFQNK